MSQALPENSNIENHKNCLKKNSSHICDQFHTRFSTRVAIPSLAQKEQYKTNTASKINQTHLEKIIIGSTRSFGRPAIAKEVEKSYLLLLLVILQVNNHDLKPMARKQERKIEELVTPTDKNSRKKIMWSSVFFKTNELTWCTHSKSTFAENYSALHITYDRTQGTRQQKEQILTNNKGANHIGSIDMCTARYQQLDNITVTMLTSKVKWCLVYL